MTPTAPIKTIVRKARPKSERLTLLGYDPTITRWRRAKHDADACLERQERAARRLIEAARDVLRADASTGVVAKSVTAIGTDAKLVVSFPDAYRAPKGEQILALGTLAGVLLRPRASVKLREGVTRAELLAALGDKAAAFLALAEIDETEVVVADASVVLEAARAAADPREIEAARAVLDDLRTAPSVKEG